MEPVNEDLVSENVGKATCKLCLKEPSRYTCPRCNVPYCSIACYQCEAHSQCSEGFYKDCFMQGLKDMKSPEEKVKVVNMLKRIADIQDPLGSDDESDDDLAERLEGVDLDGDTDVIYTKLSDKEKNEFKSMIQDGRLGELVSPWKPWWIEETTPTLVEEVCSEEVSPQGVLPQVSQAEVSPQEGVSPQEVSPQEGVSPEEGVSPQGVSPQEVSPQGVSPQGVSPQEASCSQANTKESKATSVPSLMTDIPDFDIFLKKKSPSESIQYSIVNLLYGYSYITQLYNGEYLESLDLCTQELISLCPVLENATYNSVSEAVGGSIEALNNKAKSVSVSQEFSVGCIHDTEKIIHGPGPDVSCRYVVAALSELHTMFSMAMTVLSKVSKKPKKASDRKKAEIKHQKQKCFNATKKLEFLLSWVQKFGCELNDLEPYLHIEFCEMSSRLTEHQKTKENLDKLKKQIKIKPLIEEITK